MVQSGSKVFFRLVQFGMPLVFALLPGARQAQAASTAAAVDRSVTNICPGPQPSRSAPSAGGIPSSPLAVNDTSRVVVLEYEAWFGPDAVNPQPSVTTCLQSRDMRSVGGGYDSAAPAVMAQHIAWIERLGVDAVTVDLTNNVSCIYDGDDAAIVAHTCANAAFRRSQLQIRSNSIGLYSHWAQSRTRLKIIPLLGGFDTFALTPDPFDARRRTALEKEIDDFGLRAAEYPNLTVRYGGKPLVLIYLGTPVDPVREQAIRAMLRVTELDSHYTFRLVAGYLDSQPTFWARPQAEPKGPIAIAPRYDFWSVVDRLNFWGAPPAPYYPTYNVAGSRVENMTASLATAGQNGWTCTSNGRTTYCPDAALRYCGAGYASGCDPGVYETLHEFMHYARAIDPLFLVIDQFNEFAEPDEGSTANSNDDAEPTLQWGYSALNALITEIGAYRAAPSPSSN